MPQTRLLNFEFITLCLVTFLSLCNVAVFYNFHLYLQSLGLSGKEGGFIIGLYSLTAMALYLTASKYVRIGNAFTGMLTGIFFVAGSGAAYLFFDNFWSLGLIRIVSGIGMFLVMASCMVVLVSIIPPEKTGSAFSLYSVAMLTPYSIMPAISEMIGASLGAPVRLYAITAGLLLPAGVFILIMKRRRGSCITEPSIKSVDTAGKTGVWKNIYQKPVLCILFVNGVYFTLFSSLFFLFEGLGAQRGMKNPGFFFTTQMGVMIVIRLLGGRIFDVFSKITLVVTALLLTGAGFVLLLLTHDVFWLFPIAVLFGVGMGLCVPPLNSLMYLVSEPQYRGYNANMMMLSIHFGTFVGPFAGACLIDAGGYELLLMAAAVLTVCTAILFINVDPSRLVRS
jgi:MFS family permease